jgi:hypothetical protein
MYYDSAGFILRMQGWFNIYRSRYDTAQKQNQG